MQVACDGIHSPCSHQGCAFSSGQMCQLPIAGGLFLCSNGLLKPSVHGVLQLLESSDLHAQQLEQITSLQQRLEDSQSSAQDLTQQLSASQVSMYS